MIPERTPRRQAIEKLRKSLTALAYASLIFDIFIAVITSVDALKIGDVQSLLIPVNYALTAVVFVTLLVEKVIPLRKS